MVEAVLVPGAAISPRPRSQGIGYRARVLRDGAAVGRLLDDPFLIVEGGAVVSADGQNDGASCATWGSKAPTRRADRERSR